MKGVERKKIYARNALTSVAVFVLYAPRGFDFVF